MDNDSHLIDAIADTLVETHGGAGAQWCDTVGRATIADAIADWREAIARTGAPGSSYPVLELRALRHVAQTLKLERAGSWLDSLSVNIEYTIRSLLDDAWAPAPGGTAWMGHAWAHGLRNSETRAPVDAVDRWRGQVSLDLRLDPDEDGAPHAPRVAGKDEGGVVVTLTEARTFRRLIPTNDVGGRALSAQARLDAGDARGWTPVDDAAVVRYVRAIEEGGEARRVPPDLRLRADYAVDVAREDGDRMTVTCTALRGRHAELVADAIESARTSRQWEDAPHMPMRVTRITYRDDPARTVRVPRLKPAHRR